MKHTRPDHDGLLHLLYGGLTEIDWANAFLDGVCLATRSRSAALVATDVVTKRDTLPAWVGAEAATAVAYESTYGARNPWRGPDGPRATSAGAVLRSDDLVPLTDLKQDPFWTDFLKPMDVAHGVGVIGLRTPTEVASLTLLRSEKVGAYTGKDLAVLRALAPHWANACRIRSRLGLLVDGQRAMSDVLDRLVLGVFLLDKTGRIHRTNEAGDTLLREGRVLVQHRSRPAVAHGSGAELNAVLDAALAGPGVALSNAVPLRDREGRVCAHAAAHGLTGAGFRAVLFVQMLQPSAGERSLHRALRETFGLTEREADLVCRLNAGDDVATAAAHIGVSIEGARTRLKSVYSKTGTGSQAELARFVGALCAVLGNTLT